MSHTDFSSYFTRHAFRPSHWTHFCLLRAHSQINANTYDIRYTVYDTLNLNNGQNKTGRVKDSCTL